MAGASFQHTVVVPASVDAVWERLQEPQVWAQVGPIETVADAQIDAGGALSAFSWTANAAGRDIAGTARTTESRRPDRMVIELDNRDVRGLLVVALAGETDLRIELVLAPKSFLASIIFNVIAHAIGDSLPEQMEEFAASF